MGYYVNNRAAVQCRCLKSTAMNGKFNSENFE